jgi:type I restriction enzyme S subunit
MNTTILHTTEYKNSPLGLIPEDWEVKKFKDILEEGKLGGNYENSEANQGVPVMKMGNLGRGVMNINKVQYLPENEKYNEDDILKKGDLLFNTRNTLELVGKVSIWRNELPFSLYNSNLMRMKFKGRYVGSNDFMNFAFNSHYLLSQLRGIATGTTSVAAIYGKDLNKIKFLLPLIQEQIAIANCLSTWDKAIGKQNALIVQKELSKKALMQQLLSGKKRLKGFSGEWKEVKLGQVCNLVNGMAFKPSEWANSGIPIIRIQNLNGSSEFNLFDGEVQSRYLVNHGDLLFAWSGSRGTSFGAFRWFKEQAVLNQHIFNVLPKNGLERDFAFQLLRWLTIGIERKAHGSAGLVHVTKKQLEDEKMNIPNSKEEQTAIASVLQCADTDIQLLKSKLAQLKEQKKGLMQVLLTGKKRLKYQLKSVKLNEIY